MSNKLQLHLNVHHSHRWHNRDRTGSTVAGLGGHSVRIFVVWNLSCCKWDTRSLELLAETLLLSNQLGRVTGSKTFRSGQKFRPGFISGTQQQNISSSTTTFAASLVLRHQVKWKLSASMTQEDNFKILRYKYITTLIIRLLNVNSVKVRNRY